MNPGYDSTTQATQGPFEHHEVQANVDAAEAITAAQKQAGTRK